MPTRNRFADLHPEITGWRRHLHQHPELLYDVEETAAFVVDRLKAFGVEDITTGIGKTGVVAAIKGRTDTKGRVIGLRADMDALPITEATGLDYASTVPGKMHACGHDGHTSILLGAAQYLNETRNFDGTVVLIFQPAEEGGAGGKAMCDDGLMDRWGIDEVYGLHNMPGLPVGAFATGPARSGLVRRVRDRGHRQGRPRRRPACRDRHHAGRVADRRVAAFHRFAQYRPDPPRGADRGHVRDRQHRVQRDRPHRPASGHGAHARPRVPRPCERAGLPRGRGYGIRFRGAGRGHMGAGLPRYHQHARGNRACAGRRPRRQRHRDRQCRSDPAIGGFRLHAGTAPRRLYLPWQRRHAMCHHPEYIFDDDAIPAGCSWFAELVERRMPAQ